MEETIVRRNKKVNQTETIQKISMVCGIDWRKLERTWAITKLKREVENERFREACKANGSLAGHVPSDRYISFII